MDTTTPWLTIRIRRRRTILLETSECQIPWLGVFWMRLGSKWELPWDTIWWRRGWMWRFVDKLPRGPVGIQFTSPCVDRLSTEWIWYSPCEETSEIGVWVRRGRIWTPGALGWFLQDPQGVPRDLCLTSPAFNHVEYPEDPVQYTDRRELEPLRWVLSWVIRREKLPRKMSVNLMWLERWRWVMLRKNHAEHPEGGSSRSLSLCFEGSGELLSKK